MDTGIDTGDTITTLTAGNETERGGPFLIALTRKGLLFPKRMLQRCVASQEIAASIPLYPAHT